MHDWVRQNLMQHIESGKIEYYYTTEPRHFHTSHAKNVSHKLGTGDILVNLDADNWVMPDSEKWVLNHLKQNHLQILTGKSCHAATGTAGRIYVMQEYFWQVGGYDENMRGWGYEDVDFFLRLEDIGLTRTIIPVRYLDSILHPDEQRVNNFEMPVDKMKTNKINADISFQSRKQGPVANRNKRWGRATLYKNFSQQPLTI